MGEISTMSEGEVKEDTIAAAAAAAAEEKEEEKEEEVTQQVMPGIEGGSSPPKESTGLLDSIMGFFREVKQEVGMAQQDIHERATDNMSAEGADCMERVERFRELQKTYTQLARFALDLSRALETSAKAHDEVNECFRASAKEFADHSSEKGLEDGIVNDNVMLDSPKRGDESDVMLQAGMMQHEVGQAALRLKGVIDQFAKSLHVFNSKILGDLADSVRLYQRNRLLLDTAEKKGDESKELLAATTKSKQTVDIKLALLQEKRYNDLIEISNSLQVALREYVLESKSLCA